MIKKGDEIYSVITGLNSEGRGISKTDEGFVIFSEKTLPGDEAFIKITKKKSNYAEGKLVRIEKVSEFRIKPECLHFGICGGCKLQNYDYEKQIEFKTNVVRDAFQRIGGFSETDIPSAVKSTEIFYYRNKMEFSFSDDEWLEEKDMGNEKSGYALGLHVPGFHSKIVSIDKCFLQSGLSNDILNFTNMFFKSRNISVYSTKTHTGYLRFLIIRQSKNTEDLMVNLITLDFNAELMYEFSSEVLKMFPQITTLINSTTERKAQVAFGENEYNLKGDGFIYEKLRRYDGKEFLFRISSVSFFQTNTLQAEKLFNELCKAGEFIKHDNVLDLYCGTGSISVFISDLVNKVTGAELIENSIKDAKINSELNGIINCEFVCSDIKDFTGQRINLNNYNKLILDPPRSGLHPAICELLSETIFEKILYVSCNPHTQSRDLKIICSKGKYKIAGIQPVDMFPHTYHVENVVSLERTG